MRVVKIGIARVQNHRLFKLFYGVLGLAGISQRKGVKTAVMRVSGVVRDGAALFCQATLDILFAHVDPAKHGISEGFAPIRLDRRESMPSRLGNGEFRPFPPRVQKLCDIGPRDQGMRPCMAAIKRDGLQSLLARLFYILLPAPVIELRGMQIVIVRVRPVRRLGQ